MWPASLRSSPAKLEAWIGSITILGIMALIVLHELGHFAAAKAVGMRVERLSLFFPPKIVGIKRGETEYMVGALPLGGYVKITGMNPEEIETLPPEVAKRAYYAQVPWKRIVVILAGPGVNLAIAFVLFWLVLFAGSMNGALTLEGINPGLQTLKPLTATSVASSGACRLRESCARAIGSCPVDGRPVSVASAVTAISAHRCAGVPVEGCRGATPVAITVRRAGRTVRLSIVPRYNANNEIHRMVLGFQFAPPPAKSFGLLAAAGASVKEMWAMTTQTFSGLAKALTSSSSATRSRASWASARSPSRLSNPAPDARSW